MLGPVFSLLDKLVELGKSTVPGLPGLGSALLDLGGSLASSGSSDDKLLEYRFELTAPEPDPDAVKATFAPGRYVLRRIQNRREDPNWSRFEIDHNTARLFELDDQDKRHPVRDDLYLVLNVMKYPKGTRTEYYEFEEWEAFREALRKAADKKAVPINTLTEGLTGVLLNKRSKEWKSDVRLKWSQAEGRLVDYTSKEVGDLPSRDLSKCLVDITNLRGRADNATRAAKDALRQFVSY